MITEGAFLRKADGFLALPMELNDKLGNNSQKIKLIHITTVPQSLNFFRGQVGFLKAKGFNVHVISSPGRFLNRFGQREQVPVYAVEMPRYITLWRDLVAVGKIWRLLLRIKPHIVHGHTPKGGLLAMIGAWLARVPVRIYHIHGMPFMTATGYKRILLLHTEKVSCLLAHRVLCVSNSIREFAVTKSVCYAGKIEVPFNGSINGVDAIDQFNPRKLDENGGKSVSRNFKIPADTFVIGFVGRIVRDKGLIELAQAWKILRNKYPWLHLLIVGPFEPNDPVPPDVEELLHTDRRIHLTGYADELPTLYAAMNIVVLPTYREGFPIVPLEAAGMELPVIATSVPGCIDSIQDRVTGTLVPPLNYSALLEAIERYINNPEMRRQHGRAGRLRVLKYYRQEDLWAAMHNIYLSQLTINGMLIK